MPLSVLQYSTSDAAYRGLATSYASLGKTKEAEDAYRRQGADPADLVQVGLMAFAGVPCRPIVPVGWPVYRGVGGPMGAAQ